MRGRHPRRIVAFVGLAILASLLAASTSATSSMKVTIYASLSCPPCKAYVDVLIPALEEAGITDITLKDWSINTTVIAELQALHEEMGVPKSMHGKVTTVVDGRFLFEGFLPAENITSFLENEAPNYRSFVLYLSPGEETYKIINDLGQEVECPITEPLRSCDAERFRLIPPGEAMLPLVIGAGLLNGFNPCSISVLLFLTTILYSLGKTRGQVLKAGALYLTAIFLVYLYAGLGILHAASFLPASTLLAKTGAVILITLGALNIKDYFWYGRGLSLRIPKSQTPQISALVRRATLPAAIALGLLVGLLTFPCMGGIYLAIIGMLALRTAYLEALGYLLAHNLAMILPSAALLYLGSSRSVIERLYGWKESKKRWMRLVAGLAMTTVGVYVLTI